MQKAGKKIYLEENTKSAKKIQEDFRNKSSDNNNQTNENQLRYNILDKAKQQLQMQLKIQLKLVELKISFEHTFELLDGDLDINLQKGTVE